MRYPLVVDPPEGPISAKYKKHGLFSYPTYILLDRDGAIAGHSSVSSEPNLRLYLLESVRLAILRGTESGGK